MFIFCVNRVSVMNYMYVYNILYLHIFFAIKSPLELCLFDQFILESLYLSFVFKISNFRKEYAEV